MLAREKLVMMDRMETSIPEFNAPHTIETKETIILPEFIMYVNVSSQSFGEVVVLLDMVV